MNKNDYRYFFVDSVLISLLLVSLLIKSKILTYVVIVILGSWFAGLILYVLDSIVEKKGGDRQWEYHII